MSGGGGNNFPAVGTPLADWTWEQIIALANSGENPQNYFAVGDEKNLVLTTGEVVPVLIGDFYHNTITGTTTQAAFAFSFKNCLNTKYTMNGTNSGGWPASQMRNSIVPSILNTFPAELTANNAIKYVDVISGVGNGENRVTTSSDRLRMLSVTELGTSNTNAVKGEGTKYAYYTSGTRRRKKIGTSNAQYYTRTPFGISGNSNNFGSLSMVAISTSGGTEGLYANTSAGVSFAFDI